MQEQSNNTRKRVILFIFGCLAALVVYSVIVRPLRNIFDDRWPYINVFLVAPGQAAITICVLVGLICCVIRHREFPNFYRRMGIGFTLLLASGLLNSMYNAWAMDHRTQLDKIIFDVPWRMFVWKWYFFLDVPRLIAAVGFGFLVWGIISVGSRNRNA